MFVLGVSVSVMGYGYGLGKGYKRRLGYETPRYEKVRVRNVWKAQKLGV